MRSGEITPVKIETSRGSGEEEYDTS